jgi:hypothetical protein
MRHGIGLDSVTRASPAQIARARFLTRDVRLVRVALGIFAVGKLLKRRLVQPTGSVLFRPLSASAFNRGLGDGRIHRVAEPESHAAIGQGLKARDDLRIVKFA